jgi:late competence protein required for DNA uptake (superfamily II DNA/RNA helicase)
MGILNNIEAVDITCYCSGCGKQMKLTFAATKISNFELIFSYCPKCLILERDKNKIVYTTKEI